ncbi:TlpA family protein disulfide reductase [Mucilaginibacter sp.]|uniref:TlpA family protein disulfide reductase n=1 Tax=Mucilaginibacter sp. TaxID=1882438 RepID=UPI0025D8C95C|nr:TlpA family protein disulfide reductase [Mucilaginibacter sp.]
MKSALFAFCFALVSLLAKAQSADSLVTKPAPPIIFQQSIGKQVPKDFYKGKILVLDFWATWCAPCIANFPHFNKLADTYQRKEVVFAIITDEPLKTAQRFFDRTKKQVHGLNLMDTSKTTMTTFKVDFIPYSVVIDKNNVVKWAGPGQDLTDDILTKIINNQPLTVHVNDVAKPSTVIKKKAKVKTIFSFTATLADTSVKSFPGGGSSNYDGDYISVSKTNDKLGDVLEDITGFGKRARIVANDTAKLNQLINLNFYSRFDTTQFRKYSNTLLLNKPRRNLIVSLLGDAFKFNVKINKVTKTYYELTITDTSKLRSFLSLQNGHSSFDADTFPRFEIVGYSLKNIAKELEGSAHFIVATQIKDSNRYDLSLDLSNMKTIQQTLNFHGLGLKEVTGEVEMLGIDFY